MTQPIPPTHEYRPLIQRGANDNHPDKIVGWQLVSLQRAARRAVMQDLGVTTGRQWVKARKAFRRQLRALEPHETDAS